MWFLKNLMTHFNLILLKENKGEIKKKARQEKADELDDMMLKNAAWELGVQCRHQEET